LEREIPLPAGGAFALFERIRDLPWAILLHSGTEDGERGRWDILSAAPRRVLVLGAALSDAPSLDAACEVFDNGDALLARARTVLAAMRADTPAADHRADAPFRWGMLGYLGYEARHDAFGLPRAEHNDGLPTAALGEYTWSVRIDRHAGRAWFSAYQDDDRARAMLARLGSTTGAPGRDVTALATTQHARCPDTGWRAPDPEQYARGFAAVQSYLRAGDCYQVNLARQFTLPWQDDAWPLFARLGLALPAAFGAFIATPFGALLCCSPERLLQVRAGVAISQPIKGTSRRSASPEEDQGLVDELKTSLKDLAENLMITDLARNDLGRVAVPGSVQVPELFAIRTLPTVHHLESTVRAQLAAGKDAIDALQACFPAGSITGAPKRRAMEVIAELEPAGRSAYCGSIGYLDAGGNCDFNVAIRTLTVERGTLNCWGGGGIVADSTLEEELREIDHKVGALRAAATSAADRA
jgi:para-aminobenzoate synthetase component 1